LTTRFHAWNFFRINGVTDEMLDALHFMTLTMLGQGHGITSTPRTAGTANSVHIIFGLHWQVKINGMANGLNVNATGSHIGCD
jgi:hypothetical protein